MPNNSGCDGASLVKSEILEARNVPWPDSASGGVPDPERSGRDHAAMITFLIPLETKFRPARGPVGE